MPEDGGGWGKGLSVGLELAVGIGLGAVVGQWLDKHFHSGPWCLIGGILLGCTAGFYMLIKEVSRMNNDK